MRRFLLISQKDGQDLKTYGVKKVQTNMKFSFIICVVIAFACCERVWADTRLFNDLKYLEYLNDLDRRNVELEEYDIHKQWPFHVPAKNPDEDEDRTEAEENNINPENLIKLNEIVNMAKAEMVNRNQQNYRNNLLDRIENGYKHLKDTTDRANQLSQYLRYKTPSAQERLEEVRMYPPEDDFTFNEEEEEVNDNKFFQDADDFELDDEQEKTENEPISSESFFSRINPMNEIYRLPTITIDNKGIRYDNKMNHHHEDYKFKEGEEFPQTVLFHEIPVVEDPAEFGVGPSDPRFYRDSVQSSDNTIAETERPDSNNFNHLKPYPTPEPLVDSKSDRRKHSENLPKSEESSPVSSDRDVEVVPYKPDAQADTAGVYIIAVVAGISAAATVGLIAVGIGWYNLQKHMKNAEDTDYPSYGITGPNKDYEKKEREDAGDRRLAQSAQMYHYQHQKQQIIAMGRNPQGHGSQSDTEEEEDEEGNYTVYECPGLASIEGPLEVKNPMFDDDQLATPSQTPLKPTNAEDTK